MTGAAQNGRRFERLDRRGALAYNMRMEKIKALIVKYKEILLYLVFGGLTTCVSWGSYALFVLVGLPVTPANALSWICAVLFAFVTNKLFVFESRSWALASTLREAGEFFGARILTGLLTLVGVPFLIRIGLDQPIFGVEGMLAKVTMSVIEVLLNYVASKLVIFRKK